MKKTHSLLLLAVVALGLVSMPGCYFTAAQFSDWVAGANGLTGLTVGYAWDYGVTANLNPDGNKAFQSFLDLGKRVSIALAGNAVNQDIALDPGSIK